ncbi:MAG: TIGR03067 domain-containing protein [Pirellulales bacterium]
MKPHVLAVLSLVVLLGACSGGVVDTGYDADVAALEGTWHPVSMEQNGKSLPAEQIKSIKLTISDLRFTFESATDSHSGQYMIDPTTNPKELSIVINKGTEAGKVYLAIYKLEDGKMIQCMEVSNKKRPTEFNGAAGSGNLLEVWEK